ncbi:alanine racemase, partial [Candidatus Gracilibacteria bacterium]|nr:alanine racemase [Candidatus Gracilibacteria bacterium]
MNSDNPLIWLEISKSVLQRNLRVFRKLLDQKTALAPVVKSNAYGHGLTECGNIFREEGADYLVVNSIFEARKLRAAGDSGRIYIAGYIPFESLLEAVELNCEIVIYNRETLEKLKTLELKTSAKVHLKTETGTNRQGVLRDEILDFAEAIRAAKNVELAGVAMHFANIEDTHDHSFAEKQLVEFNSICAELLAAGFQNLKFHAANSAAALLFPETHFDLARVGIAAYGMWPSEETFLSLAAKRKEKIILIPALTWKTRVAQIKTIPTGSKIGYG